MGTARTNFSKSDHPRKLPYFMSVALFGETFDSGYLDLIIFPYHFPQKRHTNWWVLPSLKLTLRTWKWIVGRLILGARPIFRGELAVSFVSKFFHLNNFRKDCFSGSSQVMQDYIHKWLQQKRFRGLVEFPLPPSPLHAVYRVRVDCLPMLIYQDELEDAVVQFFAKLQSPGPYRYWIMSDWVTGLMTSLVMDYYY